ncbi:unnamed protein product, partial [Eruca vesicaria subsp. sativa]|nr:unnamed protein product [Eruca vesicaria subsp. sativa]
VFEFRNRNSVWLDDINKKVDCSLIHKVEADDGRELIGLKPNHIEYHCEAGSFCSLACKTENVMNQFGTL